MSSRFSMKSFLLVATLLLCILSGCGRVENSLAAGAQSQPHSTNATQESCEAARATKNMHADQIAYTVSWDAVATDADNNQGKSALYVSALNVATGKLLWRKAPAAISAMFQSSQQQVVDGVLYIATSNGQKILVLAVDTHDGHAIWQHAESGNGVSTMAICSGRVYLNLSNVTIKVLQASDGKVLWSFADKNTSLSNLIPTTSSLYTLALQMSTSGGMQWSVIALNAENGKITWQKAYKVQSGLRLSLVSNEQAVYVINQVPANPSHDPAVPINTVQALDGKSGKVIWSAKMPPNMEQINVLKAGNTIYLNGQNLLNQNTSLLVALNASDGKQLWLREHSYTPIAILDSENLYGYKGYAPSDDPQGKKQFCSLDSKTGQDRWCVTSLQPNEFSLSATQDTVIIEETLQPGPLTLLQNIYGVSKQSGKLLWKLPWKSSSPSVTTVTLVTVMEGQRYQTIVA